MNKGALDIFALVINFLRLDWESNHITIDLFEVKGTTKINLVSKLQVLFAKYKLTTKIIYYAKDEAQIYL